MMGHYHYTLLILNKPKKKLPCRAVSLFWLMVIESCLRTLNLERSHQSWSLALKGSSQSLAAAMLRNHTTSLLVPNRRPGAGVRECVRCFARFLPKARQLLEGVGSDSRLLIHCGMQASSRHHVEGNRNPPSRNQAFH